MNVQTDAYSVDGELLPRATYEVASNFHCDFGPGEGMPEHIVLGLWVRAESGGVEPVYLTQQQLEGLTQSDRSPL